MNYSKTFEVHGPYKELEKLVLELKRIGYKHLWNENINKNDTFTLVTVVNDWQREKFFDETCFASSEKRKVDGICASVVFNLHHTDIEGVVDFAKTQLDLDKKFKSQLSANDWIVFESQPPQLTFEDEFKPLRAYQLMDGVNMDFVFDDKGATNGWGLWGVHRVVDYLNYMRPATEAEIKWSLVEHLSKSWDVSPEKIINVETSKGSISMRVQDIQLCDKDALIVVNGQTHWIYQNQGIVAVPHGKMIPTPKQFEILQTIAGERAYQDQKWGDGSTHEVGSWITIAQHCLNKATAAYCSSNGDESALDELRQVVGTLYACFEQHGVPERRLF